MAIKQRELISFPLHPRLKKARLSVVKYNTKTTEAFICE
jgi:hypothetical protein